MYACKYMILCMYLCMHAHTYVFLYVCMAVCVYLCKCEYMRTLVHVCIRMFMLFTLRIQMLNHLCMNTHTYLEM